MKLIDCHKHTYGIESFKESAPFVRNTRARLIHRPVSVNLFRNKSFPEHIAVHYFCGASHTGNKNFMFINCPDEDETVCHACESRALMRGQPSSELICGKHVHIGRMIIQRTCQHQDQLTKSKESP